MRILLEFDKLLECYASGLRAFRVRGLSVELPARRFLLFLFLEGFSLRCWIVLFLSSVSPFEQFKLIIYAFFV